jgi:hypothetical protein
MSGSLSWILVGHDGARAQGDDALVVEEGNVLLGFEVEQPKIMAAQFAVVIVVKLSGIVPARTRAARDVPVIQLRRHATAPKARLPIQARRIGGRE